MRTALYSWHVEQGGRMVDFAGWEMPIQYTSITEEHHAVRRQAGLFDIAHMGRLKFSGPDAGRFLDYLLTNDVTRLKLGQVRYSLVCNETGGILDDVLVYRFANCYRLVVNASNREKILAWIELHRAGFDAAVEDETFATFMLAIQGPQAVAQVSPPAAAGVAALDYYTAVETSIAGSAAIISRTGYTGEDGFEIVVAAAEGRRLWEMLAKDAVPCGLGCRDTLRLEAAMPLYGHEMDESTDPLTAGLGFGVKLNAGPFIGKEALAALKAAPKDVQRVGLQLAGRRIAREGAAVLATESLAAETTIGHVTSGTFSPTLEKSIAMAYVNQKFAAPGTAVTVDIRGKPEAATVVKLPFLS